jgi:GDP/UDP-N,N'-diacetylbacillosamine 2-epimerase (hydrolysing)
MLLSSDTSIGIAKAIGLGIISFAEALEELSPDMLIVQGDRFEMLSAAIAATCLRIPIAHIHGGEATEGVIDESIRHSLTKMAHIHFVTTDAYRKKVIQLGESPKFVFNVGALGVYNAKNLKLYNRDEVQQKLGFEFSPYNFLVTFHPVTLDKFSAEDQFSNLLLALSFTKNTKFIFTKPNADMEGRIIIDMIDDFVNKNPTTAFSFTNLGTTLYLSLLQFVDGVIGNSSSGIIEAPTFKIGTVNVGDRQRGRVKTASVLDCPPIPIAILNAITRILKDEEFKEELKVMENPYEGEDPVRDIIATLKEVDFSNLLKKKFYEVDICESYL